MISLASGSFLFASDAPKTPTILDLGTHGALFDISEEDMIKVLTERLKKAEASGALDSFKDDITKRAQDAVHHPKGVSLPFPEKIISHTIDPTIKIPNDIKTPSGDILARAGDEINPLKEEHLRSKIKPIFMIDGTSKSQRDAARIVSKYCIIVLTNGDPLALEKEWGSPVFFDQGGHLIQKFQVKFTPTLIKPEGDQNQSLF
jgi:conjugal transfer pilus assembly protein TraW